MLKQKSDASTVGVRRAVLRLRRLPYCRGRFLVRPRVASKRRNGGHTDTSVLVALSSIGIRRKATNIFSLNPSRSKWVG